MNRSKFQALVYRHYELHGRHNLPWRQTTDPYAIVVSEIMCQQTQVDRVIPKYEQFIAKWPTVDKLAEASLAAVLTQWQGLGYNRRAKMLHECANTITEQHGGNWPQSYEELLALPGIGPYTAGAVLAFAYNKPVPIIETNIRTVYLHHFFADQTDVTESELIAVIETTLDSENPRDWYAALMDYGAYLKKHHGNPNSRAKNYQKQSTFKGSDRQIRGALVKRLATGRATRPKLHADLPYDDVRVDAQLERLLKEEMIIRSGRSYQLPD